MCVCVCVRKRARLCAMSFHRSGISDPVAVSYNANLMAPRSPNRKYNTANSNMSTSTIASSTSAPKYLSCRSPGTIDRTNFSTSTSNYKTSSRRIHSSPARSVSSYSDVGLVTSSGINLPPKYSSTSTSSASSTTSSASSNAREYNGISSLTSSEFYAKYSPTNYIPNIHGSSSSLSTSSSSSTLNGFYRPSYQPSSIPIDSIESDGSNEYDTTPNCSRRSIDRQIKRRNTSIITVRTGHDQIDSAAAPIEVKQQQKQQQKQKQQHEENEIRNNINRIISDDDDNDTNNNNNNNNSNSNNNGNNNDGDLVDVNVARINIRVDNNDKDDDNLNHHHNNNHHHHHHHYLTLADGTQKFTTNPSITSFLSSCSFTTSVSSPSTSPNYPNSQFFDSIAPSISTASASVSATTAITITSTTITTTITATVTATATATTATTATTTTTTTTTTHASATTSAVDSVGASITDCSAYCWIETPTNTNNTSLLTNNNDDICNEFCIAKQTVNEEVLSSITDAIGLPINDVNTDGEIDQTDIQAHENDRLFIINDPSSGNIPHPINDTRSIKYLDNNTKSEIIYSQDGNIQLINKPIDNHGNDSSKPSTSRRTTFSNLDDTLSGDTFNASTSNNTSNVPVGVHQAFLRESNDQIEESSTSRLSRNRIQSRRGEGLNGLRNIGNTCFMNSVIQCMSNTRPLLEYLLNEQYMLDINTTTSSMKGALIKAFAQVIHELWESSGERDVNTSSLKTQIQRFAPRFMGYAQQDAQEFLRYLLEGLHEDVNRVAIKPQPILTDIPDHYTDSQKAAESWKRYLHSEDSTIVDVFVGQLRSSLTCTSCDHVSVTLDPFWDLSLPIPGRSGTVKLNQCLEHFTKVETLDGDEKPICSKCQMRTKCTKSFSIQKFPKILVIHLKRFSPTERYRAKLSVLVDFPLMVLDLSAFAAPGVRGCTYNLYGVANHSGTPYSGHYTAYCKHPYSGDWHEYNDSRVSSVSTNSIVSSEAYLLFYEQQPLSHHL